MNAQLVADRSSLRALFAEHPEWPNSTLAQVTGRSLAWVKKWKGRFRADPDNADLIWGRTHAAPAGLQFAPRVIERILAIRDEPPEGLQRTPGPKTILYYLPRSPGLDTERLPHSLRTVWKILRQAGRMVQRPATTHHSLVRPEPLVEWQLDFKDVVQVDPVATDKHAHAVEVFDAIDVGASLWLMAAPSAAYTAETVLAPLVQLLARLGLPERVRFDRDPRFLGSTSMREFPTPFVRFWYALGVSPLVNPPHRPDLNAFVERLHGPVEREYRQIQLPGSLEATCETLPGFVRHYNQERPHQGPTCGNRPPAVAHPQLPARPRLPAQVDPDRWLQFSHERCFARRVKANGSVLLDERAYYVGRQYADREVVAQLDATTRQVRFLDQRTLLKVKPLEGLVGETLPLDAFVRWCEREAQTLWRRYLSARQPVWPAS